MWYGYGNAYEHFLIVSHAKCGRNMEFPINNFDSNLARKIAFYEQVLTAVLW